MIKRIILLRSNGVCFVNSCIVPTTFADVVSCLKTNGVNLIGAPQIDSFGVLLCVASVK